MRTINATEAVAFASQVLAARGVPHTTKETVDGNQLSFHGVVFSCTNCNWIDDSEHEAREIDTVAIEVTGVVKPVTYWLSNLNELDSLINHYLSQTA